MLETEGDTALPDISDLSQDEQNIIKTVIQRQKIEELKEFRYRKSSLSTFIPVPYDHKIAMKKTNETNILPEVMTKNNLLGRGFHSKPNSPNREVMGNGISLSSAMIGNSLLKLPTMDLGATTNLVSSLIKSIVPTNLDSSHNSSHTSNVEQGKDISLTNSAMNSTITSTSMIVTSTIDHNNNSSHLSTMSRKYFISIADFAKQHHRKASLETGVYCDICHKTKFADGAGHSCSYCKKTCCSRCGGRVPLKPLSSQTIWVCLGCRKKHASVTKAGDWLDNRTCVTTCASLHTSANMGVSTGPSPTPPSLLCSSDNVSNNSSSLTSAFHSTTGKNDKMMTEKSKHQKKKEDDTTSYQIESTGEIIPTTLTKLGHTAQSISFNSSPTPPMVSDESRPMSTMSIEVVNIHNLPPRTIAHNTIATTNFEKSTLNGTQNANLGEESLNTTTSTDLLTDNTIMLPNISQNAASKLAKTPTQESSVTIEQSQREIKAYNKETSYISTNCLMEHLNVTSIANGYDQTARKMIAISSETLCPPTSTFSTPLPLVANQQIEVTQEKSSISTNQSESQSSGLKQPIYSMYGTCGGNRKQPKLHDIQKHPNSASIKRFDSISSAIDFVSTDTVDKTKMLTKRSSLEYDNLHHKRLPEPRVSMMLSQTSTIYPSLYDSRHVVNWTPSADRKFLIGHITLYRQPVMESNLDTDFYYKTTVLTESLNLVRKPQHFSLLGLKIVGGKEIDSHQLLPLNYYENLNRSSINIRNVPSPPIQLCAIVDKVKRGSLADRVAKLMPGDEIVFWNHQCLRGLSYEQVSKIISDSRFLAKVELVAHRQILSRVISESTDTIKSKESIGTLNCSISFATNADRFVQHTSAIEIILDTLDINIAHKNLLQYYRNELSIYPIYAIIYICDINSGNIDNECSRPEIVSSCAKCVEKQLNSQTFQWTFNKYILPLTERLNPNTCLLFKIFITTQHLHDRTVEIGKGIISNILELYIQSRSRIANRIELCVPIYSCDPNLNMGEFDLFEGKFEFFKGEFESFLGNLNCSRDKTRYAPEYCDRRQLLNARNDVYERRKSFFRSVSDYEDQRTNERSIKQYYSTPPKNILRNRQYDPLNFEIIRNRDEENTKNNINNINNVYMCNKIDDIGTKVYHIPYYSAPKRNKKPTFNPSAQRRWASTLNINYSDNYHSTVYNNDYLQNKLSVLPASITHQGYDPRSHNIRTNGSLIWDGMQYYHHQKPLNLATNQRDLMPNFSNQNNFLSYSQHIPQNLTVYPYPNRRRSYQDYSLLNENQTTKMNNLNPEWDQYRFLERNRERIGRKLPNINVSGSNQYMHSDGEAYDTHSVLSRYSRPLEIRSKAQTPLKNSTNDINKSEIYGSNNDKFLPKNIQQQQKLKFYSHSRKGQSQNSTEERNDSSSYCPIKPIIIPSSCKDDLRKAVLLKQASKDSYDLDLTQTTKVPPLFNTLFKMSSSSPAPSSLVAERQVKKLLSFSLSSSSHYLHSTKSPTPPLIILPKSENSHSFEPKYNVRRNRVISQEQGLESERNKNNRNTSVSVKNCTNITDDGLNTLGIDRNSSGTSTNTSQFSTSSPGSSTQNFLVTSTIEKSSQSRFATHKLTVKSEQSLNNFVSDNTNDNKHKIHAKENITHSLQRLDKYGEDRNKSVIKNAKGGSTIVFSLSSSPPPAANNKFDSNYKDIYHCGSGPINESKEDYSSLNSGPSILYDAFIDGLGPGQIVGREMLACTALGDICLSLSQNKKAPIPGTNLYNLQVEVIRAKGLTAKPNTKQIPAAYVKLYLLDGKRCVAKAKTHIAQLRSLDPIYYEKLQIPHDYKDKVLQVSVWGEYSKLERKCFMGVCQIRLNELSLQNCKNLKAWYKLYNHAPNLSAQSYCSNTNVNSMDGVALLDSPKISPSSNSTNDKMSDMPSNSPTPDKGVSSTENDHKNIGNNHPIVNDTVKKHHHHHHRHNNLQNEGNSFSKNDKHLLPAQTTFEGKNDPRNGQICKVDSHKSHQNSKDHSNNNVVFTGKINKNMKLHKQHSMSSVDK